MTLPVYKRKERWKSLLNGNSTQYVYVIQVPNNLQEPPLWPDRVEERIDWATRLFEEQTKRSEWLDDDSIPYLYVATGSEIYAEAIGCQVYRPVDNMPFAIPMVHTSEEARKLMIPSVESTPLMDLLEMAAKLKAKVGEDVPLRLPDVQSPMDILAQIWDKADLFVAMIDKPILVRSISSAIRGFLTHFLDLWFHEFGASYIAHHPDYFMEGGITLSADEIGNVSTKLFDVFFLDELNFLSDHFGGIGIHCCANSEHQWSGLNKVKSLRLINLARPMDEIRRGFLQFRSCAHYPWLLVDGVSQRMPDLFPSDFPEGTRVIIQQYAESVDEAKCKAEVLNILCRI